MTHLERAQRQLLSAVTAMQSRVSHWSQQRDRGDVPGWVMITVMTAGLVIALTLVARPLLESVFSDAVNSVVGT
ncbi:MAG: hypothetical protein WBG89_14145 [Ornithinimicrobium sp.]